MAFKHLQEFIDLLESEGELVRIKEFVDPNLEITEVVDRISKSNNNKAILFENVKGSPFRAVSNLYGTIDRTSFLFRHTLEKVKRVVELKADPTRFLKNPMRYLSAPFTALTALPMRSILRTPVAYGKTTIDQLPQIKSWSMDGGAFVTLPQVFTEDPDHPSMMRSNIGMYRIQILFDEENDFDEELASAFGNKSNLKPFLQKFSLYELA